MVYLAWFRTLAETYDVYADLAGVVKNEQAVLLPISHSGKRQRCGYDYSGNRRLGSKEQRYCTPSVMR